ncbi:SdpI family protein [Paenibacillus donghaensis]|nr:SdpI family protein [Paenibacillus donghaensis]
MKDIRWKWQDTLIVLVGLAAVLFALLNYSKLPDRLPVQFGIKGQVNRTWNKELAIGVWGTVGILLPLLLQLTRRMDPKRENYKKFENAYAMTRLMVGVLLNLMLVVSVLHGLGRAPNIAKFSLIGAGLLLMVIGNFLPQVKDNYLFGIRTPWTLNSPEVWRRTHRISGTLWVIAGLLIILAALLSGTVALVLIIASLFLAIPTPIVYSWQVSRIVRD